MSQPPFYVSPEQVMKDRADFARAGIARGRSVVVLGYDGGILFVADNPSSRSLNKVSEIYDRIGFAAVGKYNEFENLRVAGIRYADLRGYSYDRSDVTARALANAYAQTLGTVFTQDQKPYEVEIVPLNVGDDLVWPAAQKLARLLGDYGLQVLVDDRDERAGVKFADADLYGMPYQVILGKRGVANEMAEGKCRATGEREDVPFDKLSSYLVEKIIPYRA